MHCGRSLLSLGHGIVMGGVVFCYLRLHYFTTLTEKGVEVSRMWQDPGRDGLSDWKKSRDDTFQSPAGRHVKRHRRW